MKKVLKWVGMILGGILGLILVILVITNLISRSRTRKIYTFETQPVSIPEDSAAIREGQKWVQVNCTECHGEDLSGGVVFSEPPIGHIEGPNLTRGEGGIGGTYSDEDWVRAIRHGVGPDGKPLLVMPSKAYYHYSDEDLGEIIAYLKSVPPVDQAQTDPRITPLGHALMVMGVFGDALSAETIDHTNSRPPAPGSSISPEYGEYLVEVTDCKTCHGGNLTGSSSPDPDAPPAPDITSSGNVGGWSPEEFISTLRTGTTPENAVLSKYMPWKGYRHLSDVELQAIYQYLTSPPDEE